MAGRHAWQGVCVTGACVDGRGHACVAGEMATAAVGMHHTEMHSCCMEKIPKIVDEKPALNK